ncbi:hypothetical protein F4804DRAFT_329470 [Jackrogersella minutella]|nr:hypothetical protein F4804DRAFT_329470 [Jackrogersella minutella]
MVHDTYQRMRNRFRPGRGGMLEETGVSSPNSPIHRRREEQPPLAIGLLRDSESINPQLLSPIFARLPIELRDQIWRLSLTRYEDLDNLYDINQRFAMPGQAAPLRVAVELLLTCRAIYVEAFLTPFEVNPISVFDGNHRDIPPANPLVRSAQELLRCTKLKSWQFANISSVEITAQQLMLEGGSLERVSRLVGASGRHKGHENRGYTTAGYASFVEPKEVDNSNLRIGKKITNLTIRMLRTDWWSWETQPGECKIRPSERLRLEPMINVTLIPSRPENSLAMTKGFESRKAGVEPDFELDDFEKQGRWGMQVGEYWPDLKRLELVLETFACKQDQLDYVAECAKLWTFPLEDGFYLVWDGKEEGASRWRGARSYDYQMYGSWFEEQNNAENNETQDSTLIQWRPTTDSPPVDGQEFVIRTLAFERKRDEGRMVPSEF